MFVALQFTYLIKKNILFQQKYQRYKDGSPLWSMNSLGTGLDTNLPNDKPAYYLSPQQIQMMQLLQQNQVRSNVKLNLIWFFISIVLFI